MFTLVWLACSPPDTDTSVDTDLPTALTGSLTYRTEVDAAVRCDLDVDVRGTSSERACPGCTWAYDVVGTVTRDGSSADCHASPVVTFVPGFGYTNLALAAAPAFLVDWVEPPVELSDVLLSGYSHDGGDYVLDDVWEPLSWTGDPNGSWTQADGLHWSRAGSWEESESLLDGWATCDDFVLSDATTAAVGAAVQEDLPCDAGALDLWTFTGASGDDVAISVDTVAADSAFSPFFFVNGPADCTFIDAIDDVPCAFDSTNNGRSCPAAAFTLPDDGEYTLRVGSDLGCTGDVGAYALTTSGINDLTLAIDDRTAITEVVRQWTESLTFTANIE